MCLYLCVCMCVRLCILIWRVRDEIRMTIAAYQTLYESRWAFFFLNCLLADFVSHPSLLAWFCHLQRGIRNEESVNGRARQGRHGGTDQELGGRETAAGTAGVCVCVCVLCIVCVYLCACVYVFDLKKPLDCGSWEKRFMCHQLPLEKSLDIKYT